MITYLLTNRPGSRDAIASKNGPNQTPKYYSKGANDQIEYLNYPNSKIQIIQIICNTFKRLKLVQILQKKLKIHRYLIMFTEVR